MMQTSFERCEDSKILVAMVAAVTSMGSIGFNFKFTELQAVIGIEQMKKLLRES